MAFVVLWASLECTNFSRAKGGLPRDADSRTLAEHLFRYIEDVYKRQAYKRKNARESKKISSNSTIGPAESANTSNL